MSGIEILGIAASVLQIADLGGKLSVKLFTFSRKIKNVDKQIDSVSKDIAATGAVLQLLGNELKKDEHLRLCSPNAVTEAKNLMEACRTVFDELNDVMEGKGKARGAGKWLMIKRGISYVFVEEQILLLKAKLENLKSSLLVMLNVLIFAGQLKGSEALPVLQDQRELLKQLVEEKLQHEKQFDLLLKRLDNLTFHTDDEASSTIQSSTASESMGGSITLVSTKGRAPPVLSENEKDVLKPHLPTHLHDRAEEVFDHCRLVRALIDEVNQVQYKVDLGIKYRVQQKILENHHHEWGQLWRQYHGDDYYDARFQYFKHCPALRRYWIEQDSQKSTWTLVPVQNSAVRMVPSSFFEKSEQQLLKANQIDSVPTANLDHSEVDLQPNSDLKRAEYMFANIASNVGKFSHDSHDSQEYGRMLMGLAQHQKQLHILVDIIRQNAEKDFPKQTWHGEPPKPPISVTLQKYQALVKLLEEELAVLSQTGESRQGVPRAMTPPTTQVLQTKVQSHDPRRTSEQEAQRIVKRDRPLSTRQTNSRSSIYDRETPPSPKKRRVEKDHISRPCSPAREPRFPVPTPQPSHNTGVGVGDTTIGGPVSADEPLDPSPGFSAPGAASRIQMPALQMSMQQQAPQMSTQSPPLNLPRLISRKSKRYFCDVPDPAPFALPRISPIPGLCTVSTEETVVGGENIAMSNLYTTYDQREVDSSSHKGSHNSHVGKPDVVDELLIQYTLLDRAEIAAYGR